MITVLHYKVSDSSTVSSYIQPLAMHRAYISEVLLDKVCSALHDVLFGTRKTIVAVCLCPRTFTGYSGQGNYTKENASIYH